MWIALLLGAAAGCTSRLPNSTPTGTLAPSTATHPLPAPPWKAYSNEDFKFAFDHPEEVEVLVETDGPFQVLVYTDPQAPFYVRATREYLPGDVSYLLDTPSTGQRKYGPYSWDVFELPNGYGDAMGFTPPIFALQMEAGDVLYSLLFYGQGTTTELQDRIVSTFRVLD